MDKKIVKILIVGKMLIKLLVEAIIWGLVYTVSLYILLKYIIKF